MLSFVLIIMISNIVGDGLIDLSFCRYVVAHVHGSGQQIQPTIFAPRSLLCWVKWSILEYIWLDIICFLSRWFFGFFWVWKEINSSGNGRRLARWMREYVFLLNEISVNVLFDLDSIWFDLVYGNSFSS